MTLHAQTRMAQRCLSVADIAYVCCYGRAYYRAGAAHYVLRQCDIPTEHKKLTERLNGIVVLIDKKRCEILTVYQDPKALKKIRKKQKWRWKCNQ